MNRLVLAAAAFVIAGCGEASTPEDEIRASAHAGAAALFTDHPERACQYMVDRDKCVGAMVLVKGMDIAAVTGMPDDWEARLDKAEITIEGDTATVGDFSGDGKPGRYLRKDGTWLADNR